MPSKQRSELCTEWCDGSKPTGEEEELESVTLKNNGGTTVSLIGWKPKDRVGGIWSLAPQGDIAAGESKTIIRCGMPMSLNNSGDLIMLLNASGQEIDTYEYPAVSEGQMLNTGH